MLNWLEGIVVIAVGIFVPVVSVAVCFVVDWFCSDVVDFEGFCVAVVFLSIRRVVWVNDVVRFSWLICVVVCWEDVLKLLLRFSFSAFSDLVTISNVESKSVGVVIVVSMSVVVLSWFVLMLNGLLDEGLFE